jgi:hypothetical protein
MIPMSNRPKRLMVEPDEPRCTVQLRLLLKERDAWHAEAEASGLTLSEWLRRAANAQVGRCPSCHAKK